MRREALPDRAGADFGRHGPAETARGERGTATQDDGQPDKDIFGRVRLHPRGRSGGHLRGLEPNGRQQPRRGWKTFQGSYKDSQLTKTPDMF